MTSPPSPIAPAVRLFLPDAAAVGDIATLAGRARSLAPNGSLRLVAAGRTLACYAGILDGSGLFGAGMVLGLRVLELAEPADADITVRTATLSDLGGGRVVDLEPDGPIPRWAAQTPPRTGWEPLGVVDGTHLHAAATSRDLLAQADGLPRGITHGVALAIRGLGILDGDPGLHRSGPWLRLTTRRGHVLTRP